jgi:hypothetical protein
LSPHPNSKKARQEGARTSSPTDASAKREARLARQVEQRRRLERQRRLRRLRNAVLGVAAIAVVAAGVWLLARPEPELAGVTRPPDAGRGHVQGATFGSATPTSGRHDPRAPRCGTYRQPLDPSLAVHALEHGTVVLWYDADRPELAEQLEEATERWDSHVLISANAQLDQPVVATAWRRLKAYDDAGDPEIAEFVDTYRRRGPERQPCDR